MLASFFRMTADGGVEILAKADNSNETRVISILGESMASEWTIEPPYLRSTLESGDELLIILGGDRADDFRVPCDFTVRRQTGVRLMGTAATTAQLDEILERWRTTGEGNGGGYIGLAHWVVLARPTVDSLRDAIEDLAADDALANVLEIVTEPE